MKTREPFHLEKTSIGEGTMLIEASAGTGKTFTIAGLVLRLLLERPELTIDRILVTTFTELATAELRGRIRELLGKAQAAFRGSPTNNENLRALLAVHPDHPAAAQRLHDALVNFDEAPIYTIHGFCQRVLTERAFESGALFDGELIINQAELLEEVAHDFWRKNFYGGERFASLLALKNGISPGQLLEDLDELTRNPTLRILPNEFRPLGEISAELEATLLELRFAWAREAESIRDLFANLKWAKGKLKNAAERSSLPDDLEQCLSAEGGSLEQLQCLQTLAAKAVVKGVKVGFPPPAWQTFEHCQTITDLEAEFCVVLRAEFFAWARAELRTRKLARNVFSFDDLLTRLDDALAGPGGVELAAAIRAKYAAALIDEFQDTDPVQYSIFFRIYGGSNAPVAFIGDPKQAIYAFRGADVFTYMKAAAETARKFTLTTNWRSESGLVDAINTIFDREKPFLLEEIQFDPVSPSPRADEKPLLIGGRPAPPFHLWLAGKDDDIYESVASEVVQLLESDAVVGDQPLEPRHLAILTSTNSQATQMQNALRARRIPSVLYSSANIFVSHEARELRDVLAAVAQPGYEKFVRAALCTDALGRTANDLDVFARDETAWETELLGFQKHHELWRDRGFIQMLRHLSVEHGIRRRLLGYPDGERRLTNFLHLAELLHSACVKHRLGMNGLLKWLGQRLRGKSFADRDAHELRLESDGHAVRIITVHKSKGLEFDLVFCPFAGWTGPTRSAFHDPAAENALTLDLADEESHKPRQEEEALAEQLRQFYVALTRARHRCVMTWAARDKDKSAPAHLLGSHSALPPEIVANANIAVSALPEPNASNWESGGDRAEALATRHFSGKIDRSWGIASFTRLISGRETDVREERPLIEVVPEPVEIAEAVKGIHAFPKGIRAGTCLHEILELVDFANLATLPEIVQRKLRTYHMVEHDETVTRNIRTLASLPLAGPEEPFALADVPNEKRIAELEFSFPIARLTTKKLGQVLQMPEVALRLERLQFEIVNGFMNGFIDLTFEHDGRCYFADWKSNGLGPNEQAYHASALAAEMERNFYTLQLCLYSVALHRYLRVRKPDYDFDRHFGGAFYIFLRGIDPAEPANGVYFQRLSRDLVEKLSGVFEE